MSRYTLPSLVAREALRRGKNKHNLNTSCSPRSAPRIHERSHGTLSFFLLHPRLTEVTTLQCDNIAHKHAMLQQFRDAIIMQRARARANSLAE